MRKKLRKIFYSNKLRNNSHYPSNVRSIVGLPIMMLGNITPKKCKDMTGHYVLKCNIDFLISKSFY